MAALEDAARARSPRSRARVPVVRIFGSALLAIGLAASVASVVSAQGGRSDQSHQLGGLTPLALLGWLMIGARHPRALLLGGLVVGATWVASGVWLSADAHSAGPYVLAGGVAVCAIAVIGFIVPLVRRRPSRPTRAR